MQWIVACISGPELFTATNVEGVNYMNSVGKENLIRNRFVNELAAGEYAKQQAIEKPSRQFAVFKIDRIFETTTPKVIEKELTERGEVVLKKVNPNV